MERRTGRGSEAAVPLKVSVVVPVYNPGSYIERAVRSIVEQSMPATAFEAIFVDDGSTDGTAAWLDDLAARRPNIRVIHQENSGWPGKPRNVGLAAARGEYVFFMDDDDAFGRQALARLHRMATRSGADIVIGKMAGRGRRVPLELFATDRAQATLADTPLIDSLTAHKLFRRAFLEEQDLRFPEGRRRLEDHVFVLRAYFAAPRIAVLSNYVCYVRYRREDRANISTGRVDPVTYYAALREVLGIVEDHTSPGALRDRLVSRFARVELLGRLLEHAAVRRPSAQRAAMFVEARSVILEHVPTSVDELLSPFQRAAMALVRADRRDLLTTLARAERRTRAGLTASRVEPVGRQRLRLETTITLRGPHGAPLLAGREPELLLGVPVDVAAVVPAAARTVRLPLDGASLILRRRTDSADLVVPPTVRTRIVEAAGGSRLVIDLTADIAPFSLPPAGTLWRGAWSALVRVDTLGLDLELPVRQPTARGSGWEFTVLRRGRVRVLASWIGEEATLTLEPRWVRHAKARSTGRTWLRRGRRIGSR